ncbi:hypothetical protein KPL70_020310 [Citrus sinensis]|nr:putative disease resistance protein RGA3 [Citrus sinensis]XP_024035787.1 putative disease resistance protein RGA3 [Citrus x clementina]XP_024035788.1 putative disease resistance protein RGA3 [Citrus x clementina]XP_024035789.1 putative disease resistance protein RGA3 [Citrus x clementina]XP_024035790.1 putative disease resistance protein RGA3 [Citrus x clementina]XP_024035791.1 putative disease resistance protein RGA3 [Citrus x clementina]XP_052300481.1 putative disease resistance protein 
MADAAVSRLLELLVSISTEENREEGRLIVGDGKEVKRLVSNFQASQAFLADAEQRQVKEEAVRLWLDQLKDACYDMEDVLDEWITTRLKLQIEGVLDDHESAPTLVSQKVCSFLPAACFCFNFRAGLHRGIAIKIKELNECVDDIAKQRDMFGFNVSRSVGPSKRLETTSLVDESAVYGRDEEKNTLISKLLSESSEKIRGLHIISIVGMAGIGKTTLAQLAYNSDETRRHFNTKLWVCVSATFDEFTIAKSIVGSLGGSVGNFVEFQSLMLHISKCIVGKKFFLVLDDVWTEDYYKWEPLFHCLKNGLHGSKILITTRKETVARVMKSTDIIMVREFTEDVSWSLFCHIAFFGRSPPEREHLEEIGRDIVRKCNGLPLAIKTVGMLLRSRNTIDEWQMIFESELWVEMGPFAPLLLSYNDLPSTVKSCFLYCAIFPKDFQINKDKLIKLWMAQGYLGKRESEEEMEIIGEEYFDLLAMQSLFQDFEKDDNGKILSCKMHGIVHDFAQYLAKNESLTMEANDGLQATNISYGYKLRHLMLALNKAVSFPVSICGAKRVRSLLIQYGVTNCSSISEVLPKIFNELTSLRALDLSGQFWWEKVIITIPEGIERLILLRYLNLSSLKMKELPEKLCELINLQTLELSWCTNLRKLPEGMEKLIRLRHLVNVETSLSYIPRGIERLTSLRTLSEFVVSGDGKACTLASLKNLNHLQGSLSVKNLGSVTDFSVVKEANLQNKRKIIRLYLNFENDAEELRMNKDDESRMFTDERVLEALQPPPNLEFLEIRGYKGNASYLDCIMSLSVLRTLNLHGCTNLDHLPPLGKLSSLESLSISSMRSVRVGNELLGIRSIDASSSSSDIVFPKLKSLKFVNMEEWEDWDCGTIMPCLRFLSLVHCPKLKALPGHILQTDALEELTINWCTVLEERYNETGEDWDKISRIPSIIINFEFVKRGRP